MSKKSQKPKIKKPNKTLNLRELGHKDLPASVGLVKEVRSELIAEIRAVKYGLEGEIDSLRGEIGCLRGEVHKIKSSIHRCEALIEEQRNEARVVLDGIKNLSERQDRAEDEMKELRSMVYLFVKASRDTRKSQ